MGGPPEYAPDPGLLPGGRSHDFEPLLLGQDADIDAENDADSVADIDADHDADSGAETDADSDADSDADHDADSGADSDADIDADHDVPRTPRSWPGRPPEKAPCFLPGGGAPKGVFKVLIGLAGAATVEAGLPDKTLADLATTLIGAPAARKILAGVSTMEVGAP